MKVLSFCESVHASGSSPWHLRWLDKRGPMLGGGITTPTLCQRVTQGWDLDVAITGHHLKNNTCWRCLAALAERTT